MENLDNEKILAEAKDEASSCKDMPSLMNSKATQTEKNINASSRIPLTGGSWTYYQAGKSTN